MSNRPSVLDPQDLVWMVAGMLYAIGQYPIHLDSRALEKAIPAASQLLRALGVVPFDARRYRGKE